MSDKADAERPDLRVEVGSQVSDLLESRHGIELRKIEPTTSQWRFYRIQLHRDLFAAVSLVRTWGRIGNRDGQRRIEPCRSLEEAREKAVATVRGKMRKGYRMAVARSIGLGW